MKALILGLFLFAGFAQAGQISYSESSLMNTTAHYYQNRDRKIQYQTYTDENGKYYFVEYRQAQNCPYYCGITYDMAGLGLGKKFKTDYGRWFVQGGYYFIENNVGVQKGINENIYYYLTRKFGDQSFVGYEVKNDNAVFAEIGADIDLGDNYGFKVSYQYMKFKELMIGYISKMGDHPLWREPNVRDMSNIRVGFYYNF